MQEQNPAPLPAASAAGTAPGNTASVITPPSSVTANPGSETEGKVTISTKEFAQLSRDAARGRSAQRRSDFGNKGGSNSAGNQDPNIPADAAELINAERAKRIDAERRAQKAEVQSKVRDLLDKDEFKNIPKSTKDLILRNPSSVTEAEDPEEAFLDVEDYLRDVAEKIDVSQISGTGNSAPKPQDAPNRETPPTITPGSPAPAGSSAAEDTTNLRGTAKTQAMVRNKLRGAKPI